MMLNYYLLSPCGNITALVTDNVEKSSYKIIADKIMQKEPTCEQVGFLNIISGNYYLDMTGGEFCGNATASAAVVLSLLEENPLNKSFSVKVSGEEKPINVTVAKSGEIFRCSVTMPVPIKTSTVDLKLPDGAEKLNLIEFNGISHIIIKSRPKKEFEKYVVQWCEMLNADALGIMFCNESDGSVTPLVYVKKSNTLFWEGSCLSGSTAVGYHFFKNNPSCEILTLKQPNGFLTIRKSGKKIIVDNEVILIKKDIIDFKEGVQ